MLNNTDLKYKIHILTTLNNKKATVIHKENILIEKKFKYENDFIYQSIDNLKQTIENLLQKNIYRQFKTFQKPENDKFQWLLSYINQLLTTFKYQYWNNQIAVSNVTSEFGLNTNKPQQQMVLNL